MTRRRVALVVLDIIVVAAIVLAAAPPRLDFVAEYQEPPQSEETLYNRYAVPYAQGEGYEPREKPFPWHPLASFTHRPPGYTVFLGLIYRVAGIENFDAVRQVQVWMDVSSMVLVYVLGVLMFGSLAGRAVGATAALASARYDFLYMFVARLLSEPVFLWLTLLGLVLALLAARRDRPWLTFLAGAFFGLATITRPFLLFLLPGYLLWLAVAPGYPARTWMRDKQPHLIAALVAMGLVVGAVTVRNYQFHGEFVFISSNSGFTLWHGLANSEAVSAREELGTEEEVKDMELGELETSAEFRRRALDYLASHPEDIVPVLKERLVIMTAGKGGHKISHVLMVTPDDDRWIRIGDSGISFYHLVLGLALVSLVVFPSRSWHPRLLVVGAVASQYLMSFLAQAEVRYRVPVVPLLALLAAWALWGPLEAVGNRLHRRIRGY